jgi:O-antigen/teichoic acid export membrane protein
MIAVALVWWLAEWPLAFLGLIFTVPEVILTLVFGGWSLRQIGPGAHDPLKPWLGRLFSFAWRGCFHGMLAETNGRVDVIMIGLFLGDREVGLYSFAAMIAEGFFNILVVGRNQVAPLLARHMAEGRSQDIQGLFRRLSWRLWLGSGVIALAIGAAYPLAVDLLMGDAAYLVAWPALGVLLIGMAVYGAFAPFDTLLMQSGYPGWQSIQMAMVLLANALLNALLIPAFGLSGAALATALSFGVGALVLLGLTRRLLGFGLFSKGG